MKVHGTSLPGVMLVELQVFEDARGYLFESYNRQALKEAGIEAEFVQDNQSRSARNVLRGLHYQVNQAQGKLVRVLVGEVFDVAVDLRRSSASFGRWVGHRLSAANRRMLWIPTGFAHGFLALTDGAEVLYKLTAHYSPADQRCLAWNDADVGIQWPLEGAPRLSERDAAGLPLRSAETFA